MGRRKAVSREERAEHVKHGACGGVDNTLVCETKGDERPAYGLGKGSKMRK